MPFALAARSQHGKVRRILIKLRMILDAQGLSDREVARRTGMNHTALGRVMNDQSASPLLATVCAIAEGAGATVEVCWPHHAPLMNLTESEVRAVLSAAQERLRQRQALGQPVGALHSALRKTGVIP